MDREQLIEKAKIYHTRVFANGGCYRPTNGTEPLITTFLTNFAAEILPERDAEIADKLDAMPFVWGKEMRDFIDGLRGKQIREALGK